ncbi:MAG: tRNA-dihydrouridine synthase family protein [Phycisphaeraceae bacterium]|nr:tRNA-dihydrouridine synthase family protein [Phycisphaeraceae bacterium]MCW5762411.1 tRNA-dihydrouridine synthase family protein [Phycisphaeraceae bacterium]
MSCDGNNATPPSPAIAPRLGPDPGAHELDPRRIADSIIHTFDGQSVDPRLPALVPGFDAPFVQAGLAGYSDAAMRLIARRHGCPLCVTEALLDRTLLAGGRGFAKADLGDIDQNIPGGPDDHPLVGQIMGSDPAEMAAAAVKMIEQGARREKAYRALVGAGAGPIAVESHAERTFAAIDINLACPVKKIARKARGGHWLAEPDGAIAMLEAVRDALPASIPVTVKMRRSFDDTPAMRDNFLRIFDAAYDLGVAWVTVHARTVEQKYIGPSRWDLLREIVQRRHPGRCRERLVFGSGDVWNVADIFRMLAYTGVSAVSVARGCIGNPWIFRQARQILAGAAPAAPTLAEQRAVLEEHYALALAVNRRMRDPDIQTAKMMRKFGVRFSEHHPSADTVRRAFIACKSIDDWRAVLEAQYA